MHSQQRIEAALDVARKCLSSRFSGASHLFVAGSIMRGEGNEFSDIDLVVLFPRLPRAWRESFVMDGFPVEAFVHDPESLAHFIEQDIKSGAPIIVHMVANGVIVGDAPEPASSIQQRAQVLLENGPRPLGGEPYDTMRYFLSDLAEDLRADRPVDEVAAIAGLTYPRLIDLILLGRHQWTGKGKWGRACCGGLIPSSLKLQLAPLRTPCRAKRTRCWHSLTRNCHVTVAHTSMATAWTLR